MKLSLPLMILVCCACWWQEGKGRVLNKDNESLVNKLERKELQRELRNIRGHWYRTREAHNGSSSVEEQEAILFRYVLVNLLHTLQRSIRVISSLIRVCGDTFAGVLSGVVKATGGLLGLTANVFCYVSAKLELHQPDIAPYLGNVSTSCANGLKHSAVLLRGLGEACIWSGEILETMTLGLGEAVEDSFWGLEVVSNSSNVFVQFLLQIEENSGISLNKLAGSSAFIHDISIMNLTGDLTSSSTNSNYSTKSNDSKDALSKAPLKHRSDLLHQNHETQNRHHTSATLDAKLGKEWVAPYVGAGVVAAAELSPASSSSSSSSSTSSSSSSGSSSHSRKERATAIKESTPHHQHTSADDKTESRPSPPLMPPPGQQPQQQHAHQHSHEGSDSRRRSEELDMGVAMSILWEYMQICYVFCAHHLPSVLPKYGASLYSAGAECAHLSVTIVMQMTAAVIAAHALNSDVPSQGLFFLFALIAVFVLSVAPFPSIRAKVLAVAGFCGLVYVSFVTTESIQRSRLVQQTSVRAAHDLLKQQSQQRSWRRNSSGAEAGYSNAGYAHYQDSIYDTFIQSTKPVCTTGAGGDSFSKSDMCSNSAADGYIDMSQIHQDGTIDSTTSTGVPGQYPIFPTTASSTTPSPPQTAASTAHSSSLPQQNQQAQNTPADMYAEEEILHFDDAIWLNTALTSMWEVLDRNFSTGGLGPYISDMYADMVNTELAKVPPGVANVRLKSFELGHSSPLFKGVRVIRARNHTCLQEALYQELHRTGGGDSGGGEDETSTPINSSSRSRRKDDVFNITAHENFLSKLWHFIDQRGVFPQRQDDADAEVGGSNPPTTNGQDYSHSKQRPSSKNTGQQGRHHHHHHHQQAYSASHMKFLNQFSAECDRLILEMDTVYASSDMGIELTLRSNDLRSVVPEVAVTLSEVHLAGQLRLNVSLTADYPFLGDGQLSFLSAPQLDFSISSFGGLELSSVPYAYYWVNSSMHWLLEQYTAPHYTTLDLRHTVCPRCDLAQVPIATTLLEALLEALQHAQSGLKNTVAQAVFTAQQTRRFLSRLLKSLQRLAEQGKLAGKRAAVGFSALRQRASVLVEKIKLQIQRAERSRHQTALPSLESGASSAYLTDTWRNREARRAAMKEKSQEQGSGQQRALYFAWYKGFDYIYEDLLSDNDHDGADAGDGKSRAKKTNAFSSPAGGAKSTDINNNNNSPLKRLQRWAGDIRQAVVLA